MGVRLPRDVCTQTLCKCSDWEQGPTIDYDRLNRGLHLKPIHYERGGLRESGRGEEEDE
ncbi:MAG TPA: hypothetical protein VGK74_10160 [Symbiobacteriaceae bacterium]|jgi:hypothetical protein